MPFQVTLVTISHNIPPELTLLSAGDDQFHICTPVITLTAEVVGDLTGHTLLWEQFEGTNVFLLTSASLSTDFSAVDSTDKLFRFWIDKGLPGAQFDDMWIRKTPQSDFMFALDGVNGHYLTTGFDAGPVACDDIIADLIITAPPPSTIGPGEEPLGPVFTVPIEWQHPGDALKDSYISQYEVIENGISVDFLPDVPPANAGEPGSGPPSEPLEYSGILGVYRIDTHYKFSEVEFTRPSCEKDFTTIVVPMVKIYNDHFGFALDGELGHYLTRTNFGFIRKEGEDPFMFAIDGELGHYLTRTNFGFIRKEGEDPFMFALDGILGHYINITRFDQQGIGS